MKYRLNELSIRNNGGLGGAILIFIFENKIRPKGKALGSVDRCSFT